MTNNNVDVPLLSCENEKDLGVTFDKDLSFDVHIQSSISKANKMIGLIKRTFINIDYEIFSKLYKALIRPHLEYGNTIWYPKYKYQSVALEKVQRRATKLVKTCRDMTYENRLLYLNLYSLKGRRVRGDLIEAFKIFNGHVDLSWDEIFKPVQYDTTRNSYGKVFIKRCNTNIRKNCFSNRIANLWNELPFDLKTAPNTNIFKNRLDRNPNYVNTFRSVDT